MSNLVFKEFPYNLVLIDFGSSKKISSSLSKTVDCVRVGVSVVGLEVPHAHLHLIPFISEQDMSFSNKRIKMTNEEFLDLQSRIIKNLN